MEHRAVVPWGWLDGHAWAAFTAAGGLLLASAVAPVALKTVTGWAWVSGLVLVALGGLAGGIGLFGLYPTLNTRDAGLAASGVIGGAVAAGGALGLIALAVIALIGEGALGMDFGKPIGIFAATSLSMAGGLSLGLLSSGTAGVRSARLSRTTSGLLLIGGASLLAPVANEILRRGVGIEPGIPSWIFLPVLGLLALDFVAVGASLRADG